MFLHIFFIYCHLSSKGFVRASQIIIIMNFVFVSNVSINLISDIISQRFCKRTLRPEKTAP